MKCYECARAGVEREAVGLCRHCLVGLCLAHLGQDTVPQYPVPAYTCRHWIAVGKSGPQRSEAPR